MSLINLQKKIGATPDGIFGAETLKKASAYFGFTPERASHFFGQCSHESGGFKLFTENLNYSASGLIKTWKTRFNETNAKAYAYKPELIANRAYSNRMGNADESSGDGWKYRGRGAIQLTGKINYTAFADYMKNTQILINPDLVATEYAFESALFFFNKNNLWSICDKGVNTITITKLTQKINGGSNGLQDRIRKTNEYYNLIRLHS